MTAGFFLKFYYGEKSQFIRKSLTFS